MKRVVWIDELKGLGISLVVLGHMVASAETLASGETEKILERIFNYVYSFHIPLFFVLAGLTFRIGRGGKTEWWRFAKKKFLRLMVPYFIWGMFSAALYVIMGHLVVQNIGSAELFQKALRGEWWMPFASILQAGGWPNGKGFSFNGALWFLPVLFSTELVYYWIARRLSRSWHFAALIGAIVIVLSPVYWPFLKLLLPYGLCRVPEYLIFIAIGDFVGRVWRGELKVEVSDIWLVLPLAGAFVFAGFLCQWAGEVIRVPFIVPKALATILPLFLIVWGGACRLAVLAPHTMAIMVFHKFLIVPMQIVCSKMGLFSMIQSPLVAVFCVLVSTAVCVAVCYSLSRMLLKVAPWSLGFSASLASQRPQE